MGGSEKSKFMICGEMFLKGDCGPHAIIASMTEVDLTTSIEQAIDIPEELNRSPFWISFSVL